MSELLILDTEISEENEQEVGISIHPRIGGLSFSLNSCDCNEESNVPFECSPTNNTKSNSLLYVVYVLILVK